MVKFLLLFIIVIGKCLKFLWFSFCLLFFYVVFRRRKKGKHWVIKIYGYMWSILKLFVTSVQLYFACSELVLFLFNCFF